MTNATTRPAGTRRRILVWAAAVGLMALALWYFWPGPAGGPGGPGGRGFRMSGQATPVSVARAEPGRIDRTLRALGTVTPLATVTIRARVDGPLQSVNFDDGQAVRAGDVLAVIDPKPFRVQLDQALGQQMQHAAQLDQARRDLARYEQLFKQDSVARQQLDSARALVRELQGQAKSDQAAVDDARLQLGYTEIRAPVDGRLGLRKVDAGNLIRASDTDGLVVLTQSRPIDVVFSIPQTRLQALLEARRADPGLQTRLFSDAAGTALATGTLVAVDNQIDVATGTVQLKARFDNADESLFPNQFVQVRLRLGTQDGVTLPLRAVQRGSQGEYVYRLDAEGKARVVPVTTGVDDGERVVIESGLQAGDTVAVEGTDRLRDGSEVEIVSPQAAGSGAGGPAAPGRRPEPGFVNLSRLFILRPVATTLAMVALALAGLLAYRELPVSALPQVDFPTIQVTTLYPGAGPDVMTALVTSPLERQFGQMPGLSQMLSTSSGGSSRITLRFDLGLPLDVAEQEVQAAINAASNLLPSDMPSPPIYSKINPADAPVMTLAVTSPTLPLPQVRDLIEVRVAQKLSQISGVGLVSVAGGQRPAVRIQVDPQALAAHKLTLADVRKAVTQSNVNQPKGNLDGPQRSITISVNDQLKDPAEYERLILAYENGAPLRLGDVARVRRAAENLDQAAWFGRTPAILLNIQRQPGANVIEVVDRVQALLPGLRATLPTGVDLQVASDRTHTIRDSVAHVQIEMLLAIALVVAVTFVFLRTWRATLIPGVVVPLSLVGTFALMALLGFSINNLTLMALTIATGFVVDDAIVMIENIARHIEEGETAMAAALRGARQIGFTLVSLTLSLIAVLIPLLFMADVVGRLFREFAVTLAVAILLSLLISLTLTPMMCARMLRPESEEKHGRFLQGAGALMDWLIAAYDRGLTWVLAHQRATLWAVVATLLVTAGLYAAIPKGFFPQQDTGALQAITQGPQSASFQVMSRLQQQAVERVLADPAVDSVASFIGIDGDNTTLNTGRLQITLKPLAERRDRADAVIERLQAALRPVVGLEAWLQPVQELSVEDQVSRAQFQMTLSGPDEAALASWTPRLVDALRALPELRDVAGDLQDRGLALAVSVDRDAAARLGVTQASIDDALYDAFGQRLISTIYTQSAQYRVVLEADADLLDGGPAALEHLHVPTASGGVTPLSSVARFEPGLARLAVQRLDQFPAATVSFSLAPGTALSDAVGAIESARAALGVPDSIEARFQGAAQAFQSSLSSTLWLLLAAVVTMYIVLGVLYESLIHPVTILSTLPSAAIGALLALWLGGAELDMIGVIGIILLIGIVKKNAILMIDFALDAQRERGLGPQAAIHEAALLRFRPILMTTLAAFFSAIPLMLASGSGAELRQPLGLAMVGGLLCSQVLTLFTTPVIYLLFERLSRRRTAGG